MIALLYLFITGRLFSSEPPSVEVLSPPSVIVKNLAPPGASLIDEAPGRMCRLTAVRRADVPANGGTARAYFEIEGVPVDSGEPQRTYVTNNIYILSEGSDAEYQAIAEEEFPIGRPESIELCTPEFGNK